MINSVRYFLEKAKKIKRINMLEAKRDNGRVERS